MEKQLLVNFRVEANKALEEVGKKLGLEIRVTNISYRDESFTAKVEAVQIGGKDKSASNYIEAARILGLPELGTEFDYFGKTYKIVGYNTKARNRPIIIENNGKRYTADETMIKQAMKLKV